MVLRSTSFPSNTTSSRRPTSLVEAPGTSFGSSEHKSSRRTTIISRLTSNRIEMNVGIIAACLPTLKPLAANFFGAVSALTSGERYGSRYGNAHSRPHVSNGYLKQPERSGNQSYAMGDMKADNTPTGTVSPFDEGFTDSSARRGSSAGDSDESILRHGKGIMRTTEVRIS